MRMHSLGVVVVALSLSVPAFAGPKFLGWHGSGAYSFQQMDAGGTQICREDTSDVPTGWPEGLSIGPGASCTDLPAQLGKLSAADYVKKELKGQKTEKKSVFGIDVKLEVKDGKAQLMATDGPEKKMKLGEADTNGAELSLADVQWRSDGRSVAAVVVSKKAGGPSFIFINNISKLLVGGPAGRKLAEHLRGDGERLMKKRDWSGAGRVFEDAIAADPSYAPVRYARAAAEAQGGVGRSAMIENLSWLKTNGTKDKDAKRLLDQAKSDAAFDAWVGEPEVREILGLAKVSTMDVPSRLLERKATWTVQGATCKSAWQTLTFRGDPKKNGVVNLVVAESCKGKKTQKTAAGVWRQSAGGPYEIEFKKLPDGMVFPLKATIVLEGEYQQMKLSPENAESVGTFEPGGARLDDSTL